MCVLGPGREISANRGQSIFSVGITKNTINVSLLIIVELYLLIPYHLHVNLRVSRDVSVEMERTGAYALRTSIYSTLDHICQ